jgi:hypothetical protein
LEVPERDADDDGDDHLHVQDFIDRFFHDVSRQGLAIGGSTASGELEPAEAFPVRG